jgi:hypothetical protein
LQEDFLAAIAAAKQRWVEVNREILDSSDEPQHTRGKIDGEPLQRRLTIRYQNLATSLADPHPSRPIIDLFV